MKSSVNSVPSSDRMSYPIYWHTSYTPVRPIVLNIVSSENHPSLPKNCRYCGVSLILFCKISVRWMYNSLPAISMSSSHFSMNFSGSPPDSSVHLTKLGVTTLWLPIFTPPLPNESGDKFISSRSFSYLQHIAILDLSPKCRLKLAIGLFTCATHLANSTSSKL